MDGVNTLKLLGNASVFILFSAVSFLPVFSVQTNTDKADEAEVEIARCSRGQYFGELALVTNKPRAASAYAVGDVKCLGETREFSDSFPLFSNNKYRHTHKRAFNAAY